MTVLHEIVGLPNKAEIDALAARIAEMNTRADAVPGPLPNIKVDPVVAALRRDIRRLREVLDESGGRLTAYCNQVASDWAAASRAVDDMQALFDALARAERPAVAAAPVSPFCEAAASDAPQKHFNRDETVWSARLDCGGYVEHRWALACQQHDAPRYKVALVVGPAAGASVDVCGTDLVATRGAFGWVEATGSIMLSKGPASSLAPFEGCEDGQRIEVILKLLRSGVLARGAVLVQRSGSCIWLCPIGNLQGISTSCPVAVRRLP